MKAGLVSGRQANRAVEQAALVMAPCEVRPPSREQDEVREQHRFALSDPGELARLCSPQYPNVVLHSRSVISLTADL